jgi:hypothetical protein
VILVHYLAGGAAASVGGSLAFLTGVGVSLEDVGGATLALGLTWG